MNSSQTTQAVELLAQKRLASRCLPYMQVLDDMVRDIWNILKLGGSNHPYYKKPLPQIWEITCEQATDLASILSCYLFVWGNFIGDELSLSENRPGVFINKPDVGKHLEKRQGIKPDQPKTPADAEAEAQWLYAAEVMRGIQRYLMGSTETVVGMILETYGMSRDSFCRNLQKYVWMLLGQGSTKKLPWSGDPAWAQWRLSSPTHPDLTAARDMWYAGFDLYEVVQRLGPSSTARFNSVN